MIAAYSAHIAFIRTERIRMIDSTFSEFLTPVLTIGSYNGKLFGIHFREFKKHIDNIAWDTEVWIEDNPDHMIHFNGSKFFTVYGQDRQS